MSEVMESSVGPRKVETGVSDAKTIAEGLSEVLIDTYRLIFKSHAYHWNVTGPMFFSIHNLTEEHYQNMFAAADVLAERIRALGRPAPISLAAFSGESLIEDYDGKPTTRDMVVDLLEDHEKVAARLKDLVTVAEDRSDPVTADLATERSAFHEKAAWMLRATAS